MTKAPGSDLVQRVRTRTSVWSIGVQKKKKKLRQTSEIDGIPSKTTTARFKTKQVNQFKDVYYEL